MEKKKKRIRISQLDKIIALYGKFGWHQVGTEKERKDMTVVLLLERDKKQIGKNYRKVRELEIDYENMKKATPTTGIVMAFLGLLLLIAYSTTQDFFPFYIVLLYASLAFFAIAVFAIVTFIILVFIRKAVLQSILQKAGILSGAIRYFPLTQNIMKEKPNSWTIKKIFAKNYSVAKR